MLGLLLAALAWPVQSQQGDRACDPSVPRQFCFSHDMYSSDTGYFRVAGHTSDTGGAPDLELIAGQTYTFDQSHETNWYHPIGFAYYPNGAHNGLDEVLDDAGCDPEFCASEAGSQPPRDLLKSLKLAVLAT